MLESLVFLVVVGYFSWRFFRKGRKKWWRSKSGGFKRAFRQHKPFKQDFKRNREFKAHDEFANKQKGDKYELQIGKEYQNAGYKVYFKGIKEGKSDNGIDLVAYKGDEAVLIQCKNWERAQVKQEQLRVFIGDCTSYIEKNRKIFANKQVRRVFVTSCENIDYGVKKFVEENNVEYRVVPYRK